ncbi:MAG: hypothetical protein HY015_01840 [Bacteroidetes bacterium]|nr:hypothetical protein [Bacteroidota bacterium]
MNIGELKGLVPVFDLPLKGKLVDFANGQRAASEIQNWINEKQYERRKELIQHFSEKLSVDLFIEKLQSRLKTLF